MISHESQNLDCNDPAELRRYAEALIMLARYARLRAHAWRLRTSGRIAEAQTIEFDLDDLFEKLPEWAQW